MPNVTAVQIGLRLQAAVSHRPHSDLHNVPLRKYRSTIVCSIRIMCLLVSVYRNQIVVTELEVAALIVCVERWESNLFVLLVGSIGEEYDLKLDEN